MDFANQLGYSDITPFEVVRVVSDKCLEVRVMDADRDENVKLEWAVGGFAGVCLNQRDQRWFIRSNPANATVRIRFGKRGWRSADGRLFELSDTPVRFYDYNF